MIVTLTPNPSLDLTYELSGLHRGTVQRARAFSVQAAGKGINVSRNLVAGGVPSRAVAPVGGASGEQFISLLGGSGIELSLVPVAGAVRMNVSLAERGGILTKVNAPGPRLSGEEVRRLVAETAAAAEGAAWLAACGSLPPGAPVDLYARVVEVGREAGCRVAVDGSGRPLAASLAARPDLVKPNAEELAELVGRRLSTFGDVVAAAGEVRDAGACRVLVSLGADGALLVDEGGVLHAESPPFVPRSTVGAGDALLAGFLASGGEGEEALVWAVAWGAAAARLPGTGWPDRKEIDLEKVYLSRGVDPERELKGEKTG